MATSQAVPLGRWMTRLAPAAAWALLVAARLINPPALEDAQLRVFDAFQRAAPRAYRPVPVRVVDIDDETLARLGQWPWPRTQVAELLRRLEALGASPIALDILFAEPDRTSPAQVLPLWPSTPALEALRAEVVHLPDHDQVLAQAVSAGTIVSAFALTGEEALDARTPLVKAGFAYAGSDPKRAVPAFPGAVMSLRPIEDAAKGNGHLSLLIERDGITRRVPLLLRIGDQLYPSLAAEALRLSQGAPAYAIKSTGGSGERGAGASVGIVSVKIGSLIIPTDAQGRVWIYYTTAVPMRTIPAWQVMAGQVAPDALAGCLTFIGASATGLKDLRATPVDPAMPGTAVHAQLAEEALTGECLRRPDWADGAETLYLLLLGGLLVLLLPRVGAVACAWLGGGSVALVCALSWAAFTRLRWLLDPVMPSLAILGLYLVASFVHYLRTEAERRQVRQAFGRYLSPVVVDQLAKHPERLRLGGEMKTMTILFADIRNFTAIAEQLDAGVLTRLLNRFLTPMTDVVLAHSGTIDKYLGDCIMAFWNAPFDDPQHAQHACEAALAMRERLAAWNEERASEGAAGGEIPAPLRIGIGLNTGLCCVGNLGSDQRFDYSVLGDAVNLASRLEGQTKLYGADIVLGESIPPLITGLATVELDLIRVKGKTKPVRIAALLGGAALEADARFRTLRAQHEAMLTAYRARRWQEAHTLIEACRRLDEAAHTTLSTLYALYAARLEACLAHPPGEEWDGVFVASSK